MSRPLHRVVSALDRLYEEQQRALVGGSEKRPTLTRLRRLYNARTLAASLPIEEHAPSADVLTTLRLVQHCLSGNDEITTAFREQIVKVDGSVTLGQAVDAALAAELLTERRAAA